MSAVEKLPQDGMSSLPPVEAYDLWRARRDLEHYIFDQRADGRPIAPELMRLRAFLSDLADRS
ncbi:hypothetical protein [Aquibium microcysteis]|uniref:hypothetical protein n=1 Tax=Aquibium microcysteis TaxID=675281 RepID=UPI00165D26EB|nr:hypothetical protein [Aquibium microcysteis]